MSIDLFAQFTRDSHTVLANAKRIAKKHGQTILTPDHLLWGLLDLAGCQAETVLQEFPLKMNHLKSRVEATIKLAAKQPVEVELGYADWRTKLSSESTAVLEAAHQEARHHQVDFVDTRLLVLGMLRHPDNPAGELLQQYGITLAAFRERAKLTEQPPVDRPRFQGPRLDRAKLPPIYPSPIFIGLVGLTLMSAYFAYAGIGSPSRTVFMFVLGGWMSSVALHEFGHAIVAFFGGDESVVYKGYLTLDPTKYAHPLLSFILPIVFLLMGGLPLSGGAVYIDRLAIRNHFMQSLVSAAGPIATFLFGLGLSLPFLFGWYLPLVHDHYPFWAGLALLLFLEIFVLFLNLLPVPGLDGFGIMEPFLPPMVAERLNVIRPISFILLLLALLYTPLGEQLAHVTWQVMAWIDPGAAFLAAEGFDLFFFWQ